MDKAQKAQRPVRASFTKTFNLFMAEKASADPDMKTLQIHSAKMERLLDELSALDQQICDQLLDSDCSDVDYAAERQGIEEYVDKIDQVRIEMKALLNLENSESIAQSVTSSQTQEARKKKFKLPKLEFITFGGEIQEWLGFWSQFQKIHDDEEIPPEDKFQYLIQAMVKDSRARDVVCSFPPTASNYPKAIESLRSRFGRDDLLVEVYVRELLKLVILNASSQTDKSGMPKLYDKLESHLRALESIGVTSDKYAAMLFPLMESCLPEDILRAWQRSALYSTQNTVRAEGSKVTDKSAKSRLAILMDFLRNEVEGEQRISWARAGFAMSDGHGPKKAKKKATDVREDSVPTATSLLTGDKKSECIFCEKSHQSRECFHAQKMTLDEKKAILTKKKCCYICFKNGHSAKFCRASIRCVICGKKHLVVMCPDLPSHKVQEDAKPKSDEKEKELQSKAMSNISCIQTVVLQTVMVVLKGKRKERVIRAIIDTASQQVLRHRRVVFGVNCSPFLLGAVLNLHLEGAPPLLKATAMQLQESLYVDNCVASVDTHEQAQRFMEECTKLLSTATFELRGWEISEKFTSQEEKITLILGMLWERNRDELCCAPLGNVDLGGPYTKRRILSLLQKVFDPLGFTCPVTLFPKCLLQETWKQKIGWDEALPADMNKRFELWAKDLQSLSDIRIPRRLTYGTDNLNFSLHVFCDASKMAYAATVFLRSESEGNPWVQLVQAKSRVAPLKECTIPRLELLACTIGSRLAASAMVYEVLFGIS